MPFHSQDNAKKRVVMLLKCEFLLLLRELDNKQTSQGEISAI